MLSAEGRWLLQAVRPGLVERVALRLEDGEAHRERGPMVLVVETGPGVAASAVALACTAAS